MGPQNAAQHKLTLAKVQMYSHLTIVNHFHLIYMVDWLIHNCRVRVFLLSFPICCRCGVVSGLGIKQVYRYIFFEVSFIKVHETHIKLYYTCFSTALAYISVQQL